MSRRFALDLTPYRNESGWAGIEVAYSADVPNVPAGDAVIRLPRVVASVPGAEYATEDIHVSDGEGTVKLTERAGETGPMHTYREWFTDREVTSPLTLRVYAPVRNVDRRTPVGPLFDLRREPLGLFGAGISFIPVPVGDEEFEFTLRWQLDAGVTAVSSYGTGAVERSWTGKVRSLERCLLGAGTPHVSPENAKDFAIHAYSDVPFDLSDIAEYLGEIHGVMSEFFQDPESQYHVLVRKNPDKGTGGTSFPNSFAFGYSSSQETDEQELRTLLAHEMVHNWPGLDEDWEESAWYSEGAAEFYSLALPLRAGILSPEAAANQLSEMYRRYDSNPRRHLSFTEASELIWKDLRTQTLPYGRGVQHLILVDEQLRAASGGGVSLDDIVLDLLRVQRSGEKATTAGWLSRIREVLGDSALDAHQAMIDGDALPRPSAPFQGVLQPVSATAPEHELGFDIASFNSDPRRIIGLVPGSAAELAGLREGDALLTRRFSSSAVIDGSTPVELSIEKDGQEVTIKYTPRGPEVPTTDWVVK